MSSAIPDSTAPTSGTYRRLRIHFFAVYGMMGCVSPYLPIYLRDVKAISPGQLGLILAAGQSGVLFMPALMTFLADRFRLVASLLGGLFLINALAMGAITWVHGFWACLICIVFTQLANQPQIALGDGLFFSLQADRRSPRVKYSSIRVWGTLGFIAGSTALLAVYGAGFTIAAMPVVACGVALAGLVNTTGMPRRLGAPTSNTVRRLPTLEAARVLAHPGVATFCLGLGLMVMTNAAYYGFYPLYLTQQVNIDARWVGLIATVGVTLEIGYMLAFERLRGRLGLRGLILVGGVCSVARLGILAGIPHPFAAIGLQVLHGLTVIGVLIAPAMFLNRLAPDHCRNSVQGLYVMLVVGGFAIAGNIASGRLAEIDLLVLYRVAFAVDMLGLGLVAFALLRGGIVEPAEPAETAPAPS